MSSDHYFSDSPTSAFIPRTIEVTLGGLRCSVTTAGGVFSPEHVDRGTQVLLEHVSAPPNAGNLLDLGCGWGPIALSMAVLAPDATVWAVDVNDRALELARQNADSLGLKNVRVVRPDEIPGHVRFSEIWSNPPIRVGKTALHDLLLTWLPRLDDGCEAHLVVAKKFGADSLMKWVHEQMGSLGSTERTAHKSGFRVLTFTRIREQ